ncbi:MAG TPA: N-acetylglucosamine-6-phosphate deacetylase [Candidatus Binatia bacterium]|nr:N-acetylglucosamine-6-phosphate deacetylase [Candidatus Binatia bacterium]
MRLGVAAALVDRAIVNGDVGIEEGRVSGVGLSPAGRAGLASPGFVDVQVNGFAGVDFLAADRDGYARAGEALARTGVTAFQPTFISAPIPVTTQAVATLKALDRGAPVPRVLPAHLEGPFLSPLHHGAHNPEHMLAPNLEIAASLCEAGPVGYMTVAPELEGGLELVEHLSARGLVVSLGHSDAGRAVTIAAFDRGARAVTHILNAMRPWAGRDPGLPGVALSRPDVFVTAIVDNVHLAAETVRLILATAPGRLVLITDAIEAAGMVDGIYRLGDRGVHARGSEVRLEDGTLAGSVLTMDLAVRNLVCHGATLENALEAASRTPARLLRRPDLGQLAPGACADIVVLDDALEVRRTLVGGREVFAAT